MTKNGQVAVVGSDLEDCVFWAVPLIDDFLDKILVVVQLKAKRPLVSRATGVTLDVQPHGQKL